MMWLIMPEFIYLDIFGNEEYILLSDNLAEK